MLLLVTQCKWCIALMVPCPYLDGIVPYPGFCPLWCHTHIWKVQIRDPLHLETLIVPHPQLVGKLNQIQLVAL